jgi:hypothetical protein
MKAHRQFLNLLLLLALPLGSRGQETDTPPVVIAKDIDIANKGAQIVEFFEKHARALPSWNEDLAIILAAPSSPTQKVSQGLQVLYPELKVALDGRDNAKLAELAKSGDPWLAAEASWHIARGLVTEERYEEAQPLLHEIGLKWETESPRVGQALFFQGLCESELLFRDQAQDTLYKFVDGYPEESPRLLEKARTMIDDLERREPGSIADVADHMETSERKLNLEDSGEQTQEVQEKIVAMLDTLIEQAEEQEKQQQQQQQGQGNGSGQQQKQAGAPGNGEGQMQGANGSPQQAPKVVRRIRGATKSAWDDLRDKKREAEALSAIKSKYPPRYQRLIEQYFRDLQETGDEDKVQ